MHVLGNSHHGRLGGRGGSFVHWLMETLTWVRFYGNLNQTQLKQTQWLKEPWICRDFI